MQERGNPDPAKGVSSPGPAAAPHVQLQPCARAVRVCWSVCVCVFVGVKRRVLSSQRSEALGEAIYNQGFCLQTGLLPPLAYLGAI